MIGRSWAFLRCSKGPGYLLLCRSCRLRAFAVCFKQYFEVSLSRAHQILSDASRQFAIDLYRQSVKRRYQEDDSLNGIQVRAFRKSIALIIPGIIFRKLTMSLILQANNLHIPVASNSDLTAAWKKLNSDYSIFFGELISSDQSSVFRHEWQYYITEVAKAITRLNGELIQINKSDGRQDPILILLSLFRLLKNDRSSADVRQATTKVLVAISRLPEVRFKELMQSWRSNNEVLSTLKSNVLDEYEPAIIQNLKEMKLALVTP